MSYPRAFIARRLNIFEEFQFCLSHFCFAPTDKLLRPCIVLLAMLVTLAAQLSEVFYRALVPFRPSFVSTNHPAHRRAFPKSEYRRTPEKPNVTVVENPGKFLWSVNTAKTETVKPGKELSIEVIPSEEIYFPSIPYLI